MTDPNPPETGATSAVHENPSTPPPPEPDGPVLSCLRKQQYQLLHYLCSGSTCAVFKVQDATGRYLAAKVITHNKVQLKFLNQLLPNELQIVCLLNHPNVLRTEAVFKIPNYSIIVSEFAQEGDLLTAVQRAEEIRIDQHRRYFTDCTKGLAYLHSLGIGHRDVKADNVLLTRQADQTVAKLADFGYSIFLHDQNGRIKTCDQFCGTPEYAAPEILRHSPYNPTISDCFSLGVLLYLLATRSLPFGHGAAIRTKSGIYAQYNRIMSSKWKVQGEIERDHNLRDLLSRLLSPEPKTRLTAQMVLQHVWITETGNV